jgi:cell volume regulation protein A
VSLHPVFLASPFGVPAATSGGSGFSIDQLNISLLIGGLVLLVAVLAVRLSDRSGLPTLLLYLGLGVAIGEAGFGVRFDDPELTQVLGYVALVVILAEGGLTTNWSTIRPAVGPAAALATVGVVVSVGVVGCAAYLVLHVSWPVALLVGAVLTSTDAAAVFSVLRRVPLPRRLNGVLEAESGFNDAPVVILVLALSDQAAHPGSSHPWWGLLLLAIAELAGGAAIGGAIGWVGSRGLRRLAVPSSALFSLAVISLTVVAYAAAAVAHTSGFLATYVAALVLGNSRLPHRTATRGFAEGLGWLAQIGLFVLLGLLASPGRLGHQVLPALALGVVLVLVARPLSVVVSLAPFRMPWREQAFLSWAGLRGAVPVVLATVPLTRGVPGIRWLFDLVFVLVVVFTLVQAPTLPMLARRLRLGTDVSTRDVDVEASPLSELNADVLRVQIGADSRLHGVEVFELRLPPGAQVTLVVRDGVGFVPEPSTVLRHGDDLLVVTTAQVRATAERRIRLVSRHGRLAGWS